MRPEDVQIIDTVGGLVAASEDAGGSRAAFDRAEEIRRSVERLLAARVGAGKAVVEVSVDLVTDREQITERTFDPQGRVAISSETEETSRQATEPGGDVTVASNLPEGDGAGGGNGQSQSSETRERINYEVSETQRELLRAPGGIRRLTVDGTTSWEARTEAELQALRELVASAVGLDEARGDVLTLTSLQFQPLAVEGTEAAGGLLPALGPIDVMSTIQIAALSIVALILGLFVLRPILLSGSRSTAALPGPDAALALPGPQGMESAGGALTGEIDDGGFSLPDLPMVDFSGAGEDPPEDPATRLRRLIEERQAETIEILRGWLEPEEERA
jgi:flagellar M-ring protein FliF